jgi:DNA-binding IclR family transcriptional regulator
VEPVRSLARSLKILDMLLETDADPVLRERGITVQAISAEIEVHKTTALRLLKTLMEAGYAAPSTDAGHGYVLGPSLRRGADLPSAVERLKEMARPVLEELVAQTGECAHVAVADGGRVLVIDDVETDQALRVVPRSGRHVALHSTSAGKCILAWGLAELPSALPQRTGRTITNPDALRAHLVDIRARGYALDDEENAPYTRCISAPVFDASGSAVGCIGIDAPSVRLTFDQLPVVARHVVDSAARLSWLLGYRPGDRAGASTSKTDGATPDGGDVT